MADEPMGDHLSRPSPDPTERTQVAVDQAVSIARDFTLGEVKVLIERLDGIDKATKLLNETVNRVPTDVTKEVTHLRELMDEKFLSIQVQFQERDTRQERESRDNKIAVDAAFAAEALSAQKQDESNLKAIDKSEAATAETITKLSELVDSNIKSLSDKVDALTTRLDRLV